MLVAGLARVAGFASYMRVFSECRDFGFEDFCAEFCVAFVLVATATREAFQCGHTCKAHVSITVFGDLVRVFQFLTLHTLDKFLL